MTKSALVDLAVEIKLETEKAICVENLANERVWLPKSQIEILDDKRTIVDITLPEWLAQEKGLI